MPSLTRLAAVLALTVAGVLMLGSTQQAQAGSYYTILCGSNGGAGQNFGGTIYASASPGGLLALPTTTPATCVTNSSLYYFGATRSSATVGNGNFRGWSVAAPSGTTIKEIVGSLGTCRNNTSNFPRFQIVRPGGAVQTFEVINGEGAANTFTIQGNTTCTSATYTAAQFGFRWGDSGTSWWDAPAAQSATNMGGAAESFRVYLHCGDASCGTSTIPYAVVRNIRLELNDATAPSTPTVTGGPWSDATATNPNGYPVRRSSGTISPITGSATDTGAGIWISSARVNGGLYLSNFECTPTKLSYSQSVTGIAGFSSSGSFATGISRPCPLSDSFSIQPPNLDTATTRWDEGLNSVTTTVTDYADSSANESAASTANQFVIDDTAPSANPDSCAGGTSGSNGWYTAAPSCAVTGSDANGVLEVAGLSASQAFQFSNRPDEVGVSDATLAYRSTSYTGRMMLSDPTYYWPLDTNTNDLAPSGSPLNMTASGAGSVSSNPGPFLSNSYSFSSIGNQELTSSPAAASYGNMTVSAWIYPTATGGGIVSRANADNTATAFSFRNSTSGSLKFFGYNGSSTLFDCNGTTGKVPLNQWTHVAATRNSTSGAIELYANGNTAGTCNGQATGATRSTSVALDIGSEGTTGYFSGQIAHAALHSKVLTTSEIQQLYAGGCLSTANPCPSPEAASYTPSEGAMTARVTVTDRVANATTASDPLKLDTGNPSAEAPSCTGTGSGTAGALVNDWYTSDVSCTLTGADPISKPATIQAATNVNGAGYGSYTAATGTSSSTRTNLLLNPRALTDASSWTNGSMNSMTRISAPAAVDNETLTSIRFISDAANETIHTSGAVVSGTRYVCSASVYRQAGGTATHVLQAVRPTGTVISTSTGSVGSAQAGTWTRLETAFTAPASENVRCAITQSGAGTATTGFVTNAMLEAIPVGGAQPFFDGSTPGALWTGTPGASTSTLTASRMTGTVEASNSTNGNEGTVIVQPQTVDTSGRTTTGSTTTVKVDRNNPTVGVSCGTANGANGWFTTQPTCTLTASDTANGSGVSDLSRSVNGGAYTSVDTVAPFSSAYSVPLAAAGVGYTVTARGTENSGRTATAASAEIDFDNTAPGIGITGGCNGGTPDGDNGWWKTTPPCQVAAIDDQSQISFSGGNRTATYSINGGANVSYSAGSTVATSVSSAVSLPDGASVSISSTATNHAGLAATPVTVSGLKIDTAAPSISPGTTPSSPKAYSITFPANTVTDPLSKPGSVAIQYDLDGGAATWSTFNESCANQSLPGSANSEASSSCAVDTTQLADGTYNLRLLVRDKAGNQTPQALSTGSATGKLIIRNNITVTLPGSTMNLGTSTPTGTGDLTITGSSQTYNVLAGAPWSMNVCVQSASAYERFYSGTEFFPTDPTVSVISLNGVSAPRSVTPTKACGSGTAVSANSLVAQDDSYPVALRVEQSLPWSVTGGNTYTLPLEFRASQ